WQRYTDLAQVLADCPVQCVEPVGWVDEHRCGSVADREESQVDVLPVVLLPPGRPREHFGVHRHLLLPLAPLLAVGRVAALPFPKRAYLPVPRLADLCEGRVRLDAEQAVVRVGVQLDHEHRATPRFWYGRQRSLIEASLLSNRRRCWSVSASRIPSR